jgi:hypothetical protein
MINSSGGVINVRIQRKKGQLEKGHYFKVTKPKNDDTLSKLP